MSNEIHSHGPSWYKLFVVAIGLFYLFLLFMVSQCTFSALNTESLFNSAMCVVYGALAILGFVLGNFVSLIGLEHAKRTGKKTRFFVLAITIMVAAGLATVAYKFS